MKRRDIMKKLPWLFVSIVTAMFIAWFSGISVLMYKVFVSPPKTDRENPKGGIFYEEEDAIASTKRTDDAIERLKENFDPVECSITTDDGLTLPGFFYLNDNKTENTFICVHGYNTNSDFAFADMVEPILNAGYNCFLVNHRHFGGHEGKFTGFGILEKNELIKWIDCVNEFFPNGKIILYGTSMGAATIMQASDQDLPNVVGFIEDCGFTTCYDEFNFLMKEVTHLPSKLVIDSMGFMSKALLDLDLKASDSREALKNTKLPALFIHGGRDNFVPTYMVQECYEACGSEDKKLIIYDEARHVHSHYKYPEKYEKDIFEFAERIFNQ